MTYHGKHTSQQQTAGANGEHRGGQKYIVFKWENLPTIVRFITGFNEMILKSSE